MQDQRKWASINNTLHLLIRVYIELADQVEDDDERQKLERMAVDSHRQLWEVKQIYEQRYGKELCPCCMEAEK